MVVVFCYIFFGRMPLLQKDFKVLQKLRRMWRNSQYLFLFLYKHKFWRCIDGNQERKRKTHQLASKFPANNLQQEGCRSYIYCNSLDVSEESDVAKDWRNRLMTQGSSNNKQFEFI